MNKISKHTSSIISVLVLFFIGLTFIFTGNIYNINLFIVFGYFQLFQILILIPFMLKNQHNIVMNNRKIKSFETKSSNKLIINTIKIFNDVLANLNIWFYKLINLIKNKINYIITSIYLFITIIFYGFLFNIQKVDGSYNYLLLVISLITFSISIAIEKWWYFKKDNSPFSKNIQLFMFFNKLINILISATLIFCLLNIYNACWLVELCINILIGYFVLFFILDIVIKLIKKENIFENKIYIYIPFSKNNCYNLIEYIENNTGITMKSLWSIKYLKKIIPRSILGVVLLFWLSTAIVQIDNYQQGAIYRLGKLNEDNILQPGIHLKLPWPIDEVAIKDVNRVEKITIGYENKQSLNNLWTQGHGGEEYKLLLGEGKELVSINLQVSFKINNLCNYLTNFSQPVEQLKAKAYEIVMNQTINTNIDELISKDRTNLSNIIKSQLNDYANFVNLGIEVVDTVLESIHPPIEIADTYQNVVSSSINKQTSITNANSKAQTVIINAEIESQLAINKAKIDQNDKVSKAKAEILEYNACIEAYQLNNQSYKLTKYLDTFIKISGNKKIYILDKDINQSNLYLNFKDNILSSENNQSSDEDEQVN